MYVGPEQVEMENDTTINKTLDENSIMQYKATRAEQEELEREKANKNVSESRKKSNTTISHVRQYNKEIKLGRNKPSSFKVDDYATCTVHVHVDAGVG